MQNRVLGKHLRIERPMTLTKGHGRAWHILPNCERVTIWDMTHADVADEADGKRGERGERFIFQIDFVEGVSKGCRAVLFGDIFEILEVSDSTLRLRGLELRCRKVA
jgi:hypothetical protein